MNSKIDNAIGGYFSLAPSDGSGLKQLGTAYAYQSARSAMAAALVMASPENIWVPHFICGVVNDMLETIGIPVRHYSLAENFSVPSNLNIGSSDCLICVDYFGLCDLQVNAAIQQYGAERVLVDASQSLYFRPHLPCSTVYSPRKFVGVPDGGLLMSTKAMEDPLEADEAGSAFRSRHLHTRASGQTQAGYIQYQEAETSLDGCKPFGMSKITRTMLTSIDFEAIALRRRMNYEILATGFLANGFETLPLPDQSVPLCFPLLSVDAEILRPMLAAQCIYTPSYWPDACIPASDGIATMLRDRTLYLPCDQRYGELEMQKILTAIFYQKDSA